MYEQAGAAAGAQGAGPDMSQFTGAGSSDDDGVGFNNAISNKFFE